MSCGILLDSITLGIRLFLVSLLSQSILLCYLFYDFHIYLVISRISLWCNFFVLLYMISFLNYYYYYLIYFF